ncbi:MAG: hypothetical protein PHT60_15925 [Acidiphilium sp.]|nr:hypothetical protein [Acidiphilium sp.]
MIDFDELRKEVAIKHSVLLGPNDPILVTVTLHDIVLGRYVEVLSAQNEGHQKALSAALAEHVEQSKAIGGRIITDAADYVSRQVREAVTSALTDTGAKLRADLDAAQTARQQSANLAAEARSARSTAIIAAVVAGFCAIIAVAMAVVVFVK